MSLKVPEPADSIRGGLLVEHLTEQLGREDGKSFNTWARPLLVIVSILT